MEARFHSIKPLFEELMVLPLSQFSVMFEVLVMDHILPRVCVARTSGSPKVNLSILADRDLGRETGSNFAVNVAFFPYEQRNSYL